ncbi:MAG: hypothetical protein KBS68_04085 [Clostridiales bacterium]|nr:hypothetical protein [Candidatus Crickella merdequi]
MHLSMTVNQVLVAGLILALLIMAGAVAVLAVHGIKLMKNVNGLVDESKVIAGDAGVVVKDAAAKFADNADQAGKVAMGILGAVAVRRGLKLLKKADKASKKLGKKKGKK